MKIKNYSELRTNLTSCLDETVNDNVPILITRPKNNHCVLMSYSKYLELNKILEELSKKVATEYINSAHSAYDIFLRNEQIKQIK